MSNKGFTLIELLVVIAIIGILASIVLVTFPGAQDKARDSRVVGAIAQARTVMSYYNANNNSYDGFDCTFADMVTLCAEITDNGGSLTIEENDDDEACMYSALNSSSPAYYCADSTGVAGYTDTDPGSLAACDGTTFVCPADISS